jgi:hypothetical protein
MQQASRDYLKLQKIILKPQDKGIVHSSVNDSIILRTYCNMRSTVRAIARKVKTMHQVMDGSSCELPMKRTEGRWLSCAALHERRVNQL